MFEELLGVLMGASKMCTLPTCCSLVFPRGNKWSEIIFLAADPGSGRKPYRHGHSSRAADSCCFCSFMPFVSLSCGGQYIFTGDDPQSLFSYAFFVAGYKESPMDMKEGNGWCFLCTSQKPFSFMQQNKVGSFSWILDIIATKKKGLNDFHGARNPPSELGDFHGHVMETEFIL